MPVPVKGTTDLDGTILIVEDEPDVRAGLRTVLEAEGFKVDEAEDGRRGLDKVCAAPPDLLVLDLMTPQLDGFEVCREVRARGIAIPILILTARTSEMDKVLGFELGADDYVTKPFGVRELVARVRALLRRVTPQSGDMDSQSFGEVRVNFKCSQAEVRGQAVELYHFEAQILKLLIAREGEVVPRGEILDTVWGADAFPTTRTVDFHVHNLRRKLESDSGHPRHILTVHGIGYRFVR